MIKPKLYVALLLVTLLTGSRESHSVEATVPTSLKRVLIVYENESTLPAAVEVAEGIQNGFAHRMRERFELYTEHLDIVRFPNQDHIQRISDDIAAKYKSIRIDLVMTVGPGALDFVLNNRPRSLENVPIVFGAVSDAGLLKRMPLPVDVKGVVSRFDVAETLALARTLQPLAKGVVVITGSSEFDRGWESSARATLASLPLDIPVTYLSNRSLAQFEDEVRRLSTETIVLILTVFKDSEGTSIVPVEAAAAISRASNAPTYSVYSSFVGLGGALAGHVQTFRSIGSEMVTLTDQFIGGARQTDQLIRPSGHPLVDWNQMERWDIPADRLPPDVQLLNYQASVWVRYRLPIVALVAVILLQAVTIAALAVQGRKRRRAEQELALEKLELAHVSRTAQLGALSGAFAHELNQPLTSILANAEVGALLLAESPVDVDELKEILGDIIEDDKRAAGVISQLRRLMIKGDTRLEQLNLNDAVTATIALANSELVARHTRWEFRRQMPDLPIQGNLAQLQQIILNLLMNSSDAMAEVARPERVITIETRKREDGFHELAISDRGPGLSPDIRATAFKPFVSTKKGGLGLGLAICHSIAVAHGGTLQFDDQKTDGAKVILALPPS